MENNNEPQINSEENVIINEIVRLIQQSSSEAIEAINNLIDNL